MVVINKWKKIFLNKDIYLKSKKKKLNKYFVFKTYNKNLLLSSIFLNTTVKVYNGKRFVPIKVDTLKLGNKCRLFIA